MKFTADVARHMSADELSHYMSLGLIESPDSNIINKHIANNLHELRTELDRKESALQEAYGDVVQRDNDIDELKGQLDNVVARRGKGIRTISPPVAASCGCRFNDSWRCAVDHQLSTVACHCVCHRQGPHWCAEKEPIKLKNVMIDLETMSTEVNAAILSIGAVEMDFDTKELGAEFYCNVVLSSCLKLGMHRSQSTLEWWSKDENKASRDALTKDAVSIEIAVPRFIEWCETLGERGRLAPWSNGAGFDLPILANAIRTCGRMPPWEFYNESCFRTLKRLFYSVRVPRVGTRHHALEDAKNQARHLMVIMDGLMIRVPGGAILPLGLQEKSDSERVR